MDKRVSTATGTRTVNEYKLWHASSLRSRSSRFPMVVIEQTAEPLPAMNTWSAALADSAIAIVLWTRLLRRFDACTARNFGEALDQVGEKRPELLR